MELYAASDARDTDFTASILDLYPDGRASGNPVATDTEWRTAHQTIYHDAQRASALVFPVVAH